MSKRTKRTKAHILFLCRYRPQAHKRHIPPLGGDVSYLCAHMCAAFGTVPHKKYSKKCDECFA